MYPLDNLASGSVVTIKKLTIRSKTVIVSTTKPQGYFYPLFVINLDGAIDNGEIKSSIMTSDDALEELEKWKTKLSLELISQEEYDIKKNELVKFIK